MITIFVLGSILLSIVANLILVVVIRDKNELLKAKDIYIDALENYRSVVIETRDWQ
jgi:hypothetical protein